MSTCLPVSYTHLDVYKRQVEERVEQLATGPVGERLEDGVVVLWAGHSSILGDRIVTCKAADL